MADVKLPFNPLSMPAKAAVKRILAMTKPTREKLKALHAQESSGPKGGRKTVKGALEERLRGDAG